MHHGNELVIVATLCGILLLGLLAKAVSQRTRLPYTVLVLLAGLAVGMLVPDSSLVIKGDRVNPELILFVFLPILVFESSFSMQVHSVRRNLGPVLWLAVPTLVASTIGVGAFMVGFTSWSWKWGWTEALVFGALISATDPVAVVAMLRELGAPKRISVLIEGESLLNDGTAIVAFTLLLAVLTGEAHFDPMATLGRFFVVAGGGVAVGAALSGLASAWLRRTFNQPVAEITLTIAVAYLGMVTAEVLHVSGVMAVVVSGLWMSGPGRVDISPEVQHFLHRFWQVLASIANTLIFFLVGLIVAESVAKAGPYDGLVVLGTFAGILILRAVLVFASRPVMGWLAEPISAPEATVMAWGGLRGAVSLALALMIAQEHALPEQLRDQMVLVTAGVVLGTLLVNGTTMALLLRRLGFDRPPAADRLAQASTHAAVLESIVASVEAARGSPELRTVNWADVDAELAARCEEVERDRASAEAELAKSPTEARAGGWSQALSIERTAYWDAFAHGTLGPAAVRLLDSEVDLRSDALARGDFDAETYRVGHLPGWRGALERWLHRPGRPIGVSRALSGLQFGLLELRYELARGHGVAANAVMEALDRGEIGGDAVKAFYRSWKHQATELLEDFRANLPEMTEALETRIARRISLNLERDAVAALERRGALDPDSASQARASIESRMKQLQSFPRSAPLPDTTQLCRDAELFRGIDETGIHRIGELTTEKSLAPGETLFEQGSTGGNLFIVARGAVAILREEGGETQLLDILGSGDVLGEMELLSGEPRTATIRALTNCLVGEIDRGGFEALMKEVPVLASKLHEAFARRRLDNHIRSLPAFQSLAHSHRMEWFDAGHLRHLHDGDTAPGDQWLFVVTGALQGWSRYAAPGLVRPGQEDVLHAVGDTTLVVLPGPPGAPERMPRDEARPEEAQSEEGSSSAELNA